jgi:hypothetical protein
MPHMQAGLWREKEAGKAKPKVCPECSGKKLSFAHYLGQDDSDEIDEECGEAWKAETGIDYDDMDDGRFFYYEATYQCHRCGHFDTFGPRRYFNPETLVYDCDRPLMPDAAERAQGEHERQQAIEAGQQTLFD